MFWVTYSNTEGATQAWSLLAGLQSYVLGTLRHSGVLEDGARGRFNGALMQCVSNWYQFIHICLLTYDNFSKFYKMQPQIVIYVYVSVYLWQFLQVLMLPQFG